MHAMKSYKAGESETPNPELAVRPRELEIFEVFTKRALELVKSGDDTVIADACRLAETAFKAVRGDSAPAQLTTNNDGIQTWLDEIDKGYERLRGAKSAPVSEEGVV
jgi:hypothetical protein